MELFDSSKVWGGVLKKLRESGDTVLYSAVAESVDVEFCSDGIQLHCNDEAMFRLLLKYEEKLNKLAGGDYITVKQTKKQHEKSEVTDALKKLFGEKIRTV